MGGPVKSLLQYALMTAPKLGSVLTSQKERQETFCATHEVVFPNNGNCSKHPDLTSNLQKIQGTENMLITEMQSVKSKLWKTLWDKIPCSFNKKRIREK